MSQGMAWALGGGALVVVGLGIAVAVLGLKLGAAVGEVATASAALLKADVKAGRLIDERDRAVTELQDARSRWTKLEADLRAEAKELHGLLAAHLPPTELRDRLKDMLSGKDKA